MKKRLAFQLDWNKPEHKTNEFSSKSVFLCLCFRSEPSEMDVLIAARLVTQATYLREWSFASLQFYFGNDRMHPPHGLPQCSQNGGGGGGGDGGQAGEKHLEHVLLCEQIQLQSSGIIAGGNSAGISYFDRTCCLCTERKKSKTSDEKENVTDQICRTKDSDKTNELLYSRFGVRTYQTNLSWIVSWRFCPTQCESEEQNNNTYFCSKHMCPLHWLLCDEIAVNASQSLWFWARICCLQRSWSSSSFRDCEFHYCASRPFPEKHKRWCREKETSQPSRSSVVSLL